MSVGGAQGDETCVDNVNVVDNSDVITPPNEGEIRTYTCSPTTKMTTTRGVSLAVSKQKHNREE